VKLAYALAVVSVAGACTRSPERASPASTPADPAAPATAPAARNDPPPMPFVDWGACPFEGCTYRDWKANRDVTLVGDPRMLWESPGGSPPAAVTTIRAGETVTAMTGVVVFTAPGRVRTTAPLDFIVARPEFPRQPPEVVQVPAGAVAYALTPHGEGEFRAWFDGRLGVIGIDGAPSTELIDRAQSTWWVQIRPASGRIGWTDHPEAFDGKDRFSGSAPG
jgi:hypothetical protein